MPRTRTVIYDRNSLIVIDLNEVISYVSAAAVQLIVHGVTSHKEKCLAHKMFVFCLFNVILNGMDVGTDLSTFFTLAWAEQFHWASLTFTWMLTPFLIHTLQFFVNLFRTNFRRPERGYFKEFFFAAGVHFPFFLPLVNLWRAKKLHQLGFGKGFIKSENREAVDKILAEVALTSYTECFYEAGPQAVTQVFQQQYVRGCVF